MRYWVSWQELPPRRSNENSKSHCFRFCVKSSCATLLSWCKGSFVTYCCGCHHIIFSVSACSVQNKYNIYVKHTRKSRVLLARILTIPSSGNCCCNKALNALFQVHFQRRLADQGSRLGKVWQLQDHPGELCCRAALCLVTLRIQLQNKRRHCSKAATQHSVWKCTHVPLKQLSLVVFLNKGSHVQAAVNWALCN